MATGKLETPGDHDWFSIYLLAGSTYEITETGLSYSGTLEIGTSAELSTNEATTALYFPGESLQTSYLDFTPTMSGVYYVDVSDQGSENAYTLTATKVTDDYTNNPTHAGSLTVGGSATGQINAPGDHDWFAITLAANLTYEITETGLSDSAELAIGTASDLATNEATNVSAPTNADPLAPSYVTFTPTTSGVYYIDVTDYDSENAYTLTAAPVTDDYTNNPTHAGSLTVGGSTTGQLNAPGDHDWFAITLAANQTYEITVTGLTYIAALEIGTASDLATNEANSAYYGGASPQTNYLTFTPTTSGVYYIDVSDYGVPEGAYTLTAAAVTDDYTNNPSHAGSLTVGGSATGQLNAPGDHDWFAITLTANLTYEITETGLTEFAALEIGAASDLATNEATTSSTAEYPSGAISLRTAYLTFTPTTSGVYYVDVSDTGSENAYTLTAATVTVTDDYTNNPTRAGSLTVGGSATGQLNAPGDHDWFAITLTANLNYEVFVNGLTSGAALEIGTASELEANEATGYGYDGSGGGVAHTAFLTFTPTTSGVYYIDVSDFLGSTNAYTLNAIRVTDDYANNPAKAGTLTVTGAGDLASPGNFSGDGQSDLVVQNTNGAIDIFTTAASGLSVTAATSLGNPGATWHVVGSADFNNDGQPDLLLQNDNGAMLDYLMNGTSIAASYNLGNAGSAWHVRALADFSGDGNTDILLQSDSGSMVLFETNGQSLIASFALGSLPAGWAVEGVGDFYGTGQPDLLVESTSGTLVLYTMSGTAITAGTVIATLGAGWSVAGVADYNGDGKADILFHNDNGSDVVLDMSGASVIGSTSLGNAGANYTTAVAGLDLNGDGTSDLVVQNTASTLVAYTLNSMAQITAGAVLGTPGAGWDVVGSNPVTFIDGTGANLTLAATAGPDQFNLTSYAAGIHTISSFDPAQDTLALSAAAFPSYATVQANEAPYMGGTFINLSPSAAIVITGVTPSQLSAANFVLR